jgi:CheY-like chemotaxis protein
VPDIVIGDALRLRQVLTNLLSNAIKFTERGHVELTISARNVAGPSDEIGVQFQVVDTGIGMNEEALSKVFSAFTQADTSTTRHYGGTGLGLTISRQLVELMGGSLAVSSVAGVGSKLWFELNFRSTRASVGRSKEVASPPPAPASGRVLLAEDNEVNREIAIAMLRGLGLSVDLAINGCEAVQLVQDKQYQLVLMDCQMPDMDGFEAATIIRSFESKQDIGSKRKRVPIVALTANAMTGDRDRCLIAGMDDYLSKPYMLEDLRQIIGRWLRDDSVPTTANVQDSPGLLSVSPAFTNARG